MGKIWTTGALAALLLSWGGSAVADDVADRLPLIEAPADAPRVTFAFADHPDLSATTYDPEGFVWDDVMTVPPDFTEAGVFSALTKRYVGYEPTSRDRYEISVYTAELEPDRVAPAAGTAVVLASEWGPLNFGIRAHSLLFGEVAGGSEASGEMIVSRISVWRRGTTALIVRQRFEAAHFEAYAEDMARVAGSLAFEEAGGTDDPILDAASRTTLETGPGTFAFRLPSNWSRLSDGAAGTAAEGGVWYDAADPNGNGAIMVLTVPPERPIPAGTVPDPVPDQPMFDLARDVARSLVATLLPEAEVQLQPRDMNSYASLDDITAFNRRLVIDGLVNGETPVVIGVTLVAPADGTTLISASLSPGALDAYLLGTQRHVDLADALVLEGMEAYAREAFERQRP